jgi:hypothetical protein
MNQRIMIQRIRGWHFRFSLRVLLEFSWNIPRTFQELFVSIFGTFWNLTRFLTVMRVLVAMKVFDLDVISCWVRIAHNECWSPISVPAPLELSKE